MTTQRAYVDWHPIVGLNDLPPSNQDILVTTKGGVVMATCGTWCKGAWCDYETDTCWEIIAWAYKPAAYCEYGGNIETVIEVPAVVTMSASTYAHMQDAGCAPTKVKVRME